MIRALFYSPKGTGHVNPTLPLVRGLVERGHEVTYTLTSGWRERLEEMGCRYRNMGTGDAFTTADFNPGAPFYRQLLPATAALLPRLVDEARALRPDVVVFDSCAPWGYAIAEILGVPGIASVSTLVFDRDEVKEHVGAPAERLDTANLSALAEIERCWGIDFRDRDLGLFYGRENLVYSCEELNPTRTNVRGTYHFVGPTFASGGEATRDSLGRDLEAYARGGRRIYVSMGTVVGGESGLASSFFNPFIEAFGGREGYELLLSVGRAAESFGVVPKNVSVRRFVAQPAVLAHTDVFVTHVGANSMHEALFHGVPLVCSPHFGDQPQNAARVIAQGAGVLLPPSELSAARVATEVERVSGESFRANAVRLATKLRACGGLERALDVIERAANQSSRVARPRDAPSANVGVRVCTPTDRAAMPVLETPRLRLARLEESDAAGFHTMWTTPGHMAFFDRATPASLDASRTELARILGQMPRGEAKGWAIRLRDDEAFLGAVGIVRIDWTNLRASLAYELIASARGRGLVREAGERVVRFAFEELGLRHVQVEIDPRNTPSLKVAEALGFVRVEDAAEQDVILVRANPGNS